MLEGINNEHKKIMKLIDSIRHSHPDMEWLYMNGQCYNFFLILKSQFTDAVAWYDHTVGHVYTKINTRWYDIRGVHYKLPIGSTILDHNISDPPHRWGGRDTRELQISPSICLMAYHKQKKN